MVTQTPEQRMKTNTRKDHHYHENTWTLYGKLFRNEHHVIPCYCRQQADVRATWNIHQKIHFFVACTSTWKTTIGILSLCRGIFFRVVTIRLLRVLPLNTPPEIAGSRTCTYNANTAVDKIVKIHTPSFDSCCLWNGACTYIRARYNICCACAVANTEKKRCRLIIFWT